MTVLLVEPGMAPRRAEIGDTLEDMQNVVGGLIQAVYPFEEPVALICNEEGKLPGLPLNRSLEPLELLGSLVRCGEEPIGLELTQPGLTVLGFEQVVDSKVRSLLVELILSAIWDQRTARTEWERPLIVLLDECQHVSWNEGSMAMRFLREGRKYGIGGWFSSQWVTSKHAIPALGQAALQICFRPDDTNLAQLAKNLSQRKSGQVEQYQKVIRSLRVRQFLSRRPDGRALVVSVPPRPEEGGKRKGEALTCILLMRRRSFYYEERRASGEVRIQKRGGA